MKALVETIEGIIPIKFTENDFIFEQKVRVGNVAIFERYKPEYPEQSNFEVVKIKRVKGSVSMRRDKDGVEKEVVIKEGESYPSDNDWGVNGFTCTNFTLAQKKMQMFLEREDEIIDHPEESSRRGRKPLKIDIKWPSGEFTVKEVALSHNVSPAYIHIQLSKLLASNKVKFIRSKKLTSGKGKPANLYSLS